MDLVVSDNAINAILFRHAPKDRQKPVYYVSKALVDVETCYSQVEQMMIVLRIAVKKFRPYFQAH